MTSLPLTNKPFPEKSITVGNMDLSIVVPVYNENESLPHLMEAIDKTLEPQNLRFEVIFVDDGSTDGSFNELKKLKEQFGKKIKAYRFSRNFGKSAALSAGIQEADGQVIITMDADLQDDPVAIPEMVAKINEGWDVVSGWKKIRHDPLSKTLPSKVWNRITAITSGVKIHDFNCGFKAYRSQAAKSIHIYGERHRYLPALAYWEGFSVTEIVVPHHPRKFGKSKYGFGRMFNGIMDMITLLFLKRYLKSPLHFFGLLGLVLILIGMGVMGHFTIQWAITGMMRVRPLMILALGSMIVGVQIISIGLIGEMITHSQQTHSYTIRDRMD
ncbi:glycosyltransferase family 2 protein [Chitinispirillales bacterium ANBcel5]|uniref:glycosyltransferase family 2 protein n=1 Tax=Cellulosispirillum alkaliphilum TaxID=3039283 RepID=UPI002A4ED02A|nr:glycosyltransferase family 2 protein [Chitinispirillales bacterium ANBcel5]